MEKLAAVVLAAGASSRMGRLKPLLDVDGQSMLRRVAGMMLRAGASPVLIVTGYRAEELERHLAGLDVTFVRNERYYETDMFASLMLAAAALPPDAERVLFCPADVPLVRDETVRALLAAAGDFVRPVCAGRTGHPAVLSRALLERMEGYEGPGGLRGAVKALGVTVTDVAVEDRGVGLDGDTADEYEQILRYRREQTGRPLPLGLDLQVRLQAETSFWGPGSFQLLELVRATGSILSACRCMHMSYSRAWKTVNEIERQLGRPVLVRSQGGKNGGGSALTAAGERLLAAYEALREDLDRAGREAFARYFPENWPDE